LTATYHAEEISFVYSAIIQLHGHLTPTVLSQVQNVVCVTYFC